MERCAVAQFTPFALGRPRDSQLQPNHWTLGPRLSAANSFGRLGLCSFERAQIQRRACAASPERKSPRTAPNSSRTATRRFQPAPINSRRAPAARPSAPDAKALPRGAPDQSRSQSCGPCNYHHWTNIGTWPPPASRSIGRREPSCCRDIVCSSPLEHFQLIVRRAGRAFSWVAVNQFRVSCRTRARRKDLGRRRRRRNRINGALVDCRRRSERAAARSRILIGRLWTKRFPIPIRWDLARARRAAASAGIVCASFRLCLSSARSAARDR